MPTEVAITRGWTMFIVMNQPTAITATIHRTAFGVAVMQPALPPLVRAWAPKRIGFATAVYTNGLIIGEILPASLTIPLLLPAINNSWQWEFAFWGTPVALIALTLFAFAPRTTAPTSAAATAGRRWMPDFRNPLIWKIGLLFGSVNGRVNLQAQGIGIVTK